MGEVKFLKAYTIYALVGAVCGFFAGAGQGFILGMAMALAGVEPQIIPIITGITGFITGLIISFFIYRWSIRKFIIPQLQDMLSAAE